MINLAPRNKTASEYELTVGRPVSLARGAAARRPDEDSAGWLRATRLRVSGAPVECQLSDSWQPVERQLGACWEPVGLGVRWVPAPRFEMPPNKRKKKKDAPVYTLGEQIRIPVNCTDLL